MDPSPERRFVEVALPVRVGHTYTYSVPPGLPVVLGSRVLVPFGKKKSAEGYAVGFPESSPGTFAVKDVLQVVDERPLLTPAMLEFTRWVGRYYRAPWGEVLSASIPPAARSLHGGGRDRRAALAVDRAKAQEHLEKARKRFPGQAKVLEVLLGRESGEIWLSDLMSLCGASYSPVNTLARNGVIRLEKDRRAPAPPVPGPREDVRLTPEQEAALSAVSAAVASRGFHVMLLRGVTGSGKTEVYLRAIEAALALGRGAITLVPEISLTPQMVERYLSRFPGVAVLHSSLSAAERAGQWESIRAGKAKVVVGARSAVFAPVQDLGLLVIDEEHEPSFKQESSPRYNARDAAVMRARMEGAVAVLGSATPSLESAQNAAAGKYRELLLPRRVRDLPLPEVEVVNLGVEARETGRLPLFSRRLETLARQALERREQVILFLNRRGFSTFLQCPACGFRYTCPNCRISLTWHRKIGRAVCHYCYHGEVPGDACPSCLTPGLKYFGLGTEKVEEAAAKAFPGARIARMDSDSMDSRESYEKAFHDVREGRTDVLVGTQMIAKGLDFPNVTLVGVVSADASLALPDFRAAERTFQLITQVAGRAGRSDKGGRVVVQTFQPDHYSIRCAAAQDHEAFVRAEIGFRRELGYPPFGRLARILCTGDREQAVADRARGVAEKLRKGAPQVQVLGPAPAPLEVIRNRFRHHVVVKARTGDEIQAALDAIDADLYASGPVRVSADVDPQSML
ncbi:MAG: primosomal protein N' [Planctomycetes bacterium]|nr:primosomal protein N' [Planctomycetota bacterium]